MAEARLTANRRSYHLVAVDKSPYLTATLERAMGGATLAELANALVNDEITQTDAEEYITELVDSQILMADVRPSVTGDEPIHHLITTLTKRAQTAPLASQLDKARMAVEAIDADGLGVSPDRYRTVASLLSELPYQPELSRLVQVDLAKPGHEVTLGSQVVAEASRGVRILYQLRPPALPDSLSRFREDFLQRYETREVPLAEALDEETGIGFEVSNSPGAGASPLLAGLPFGSGQAAHPAHWNRRDTLLLGKLTRALSEGVSEISIEASDLEGWSSEHQAPLPDAFHVMATVVAASEEAIARGAFRVLFDHMAGPSGAQLLGRFCHADQALLKSIRAHLHAEQARRPGCIFAEIAHLPEGRIGNILCRPVLRDYEISYLGRSGAPADRQIPVTDLLVSVRGDRIVLRSRRFGREVVPRLTTAHNYGWKSLGVYRFLCSLQHQDVTGYLAWNWGPLGDAPFLPRVVSGRLVLSRARWNLAESELQMLGQAGGVQGFAILQKWRKERRLPRYVALADGDNELVIDFDNILSIETLAHQVRGRRGSALVEMFPRPSELCVSGPEGRFLHEVIVPFIRV